MEDKRFQEISRSMSRILSDGFELYPFKIGWYNDVVDNPFKFDLDPDTIAFLIISTPDMFEKVLIPFLCREHCNGMLDPLDKCMQHLFAQSKVVFPDEDIVTIHDFEMMPSRRPKILVQPAGHVAGAAYYYTRNSLDPDPFDPKKKICGVSVHPVYAGWFALRGVIIFKTLKYSNLPRKQPMDCVPDNESRAKLLELFNFHWQDWRFRDIIQSAKKYSSDQRIFFETLPKDRFELVKQMKERWLKEHNEQSKSDFIK